jgi:uncharacterized protein (TIGR03067 family)
MLTLARIACLLTVTVPLPAADDLSDASAKNGPAELQGNWRLLSVEINGQDLDLAGNQPKWVIKGSKVHYGGEELTRLTADPAATPKILDLAFLKPKKVYEGIYSVDQDTLKVCLNNQTEGVKERPQEFSTKDKGNWRLLVFKRDKSEQADQTEGLSGYIGVALRFDQDRHEVIVNEAIAGSPAKKAGLQKDDVILKIAGAAPTGLRSAVDMVRQTKPGSQLALRVGRGGKETDMLIKVGIMPFAMLAVLD